MSSRLTFDLLCSSFVIELFFSWVLDILSENAFPFRTGVQTSTGWENIVSVYFALDE